MQAERTTRNGKPPRPSLRSVEQRNALAEEHLALVPFLCAKHYPRLVKTPLFEEILQSGRHGLLRACELWVPERGHKFGTYAAYWVWQYTQRWLATNWLIRLPEQYRGEARRQARSKVRVFAPPGAHDDSEQPFDALADYREHGIEHFENRQDVAAALALLRPRQRRFIEARFFDGDTLVQIAQREGLTKERVRQIIQGGLEKIRAAWHCETEAAAR